MLKWENINYGDKFIYREKGGNRDFLGTKVLNYDDTDGIFAFNKFVVCDIDKYEFIEIVY